MSTEILSQKYKAFKDAHASATTAKAFYVFNNLVAMALNTALAAEANIFVFECEDIKVPKTTGQAWTPGQRIYWDAVNSKFTTAAITSSVPNALAGFVVLDALSADTQGEIYLTPEIEELGVPAAATFAVGTEAANAITVAVQLTDRNGADLANRAGLLAYLSGDANGDSLVAASATLTVTSGTDGVTIPHSAANSLGNTLMTLISEADGDIDVTITETSGAATYYLAVVLPNGKLQVSGAITFAA